MIHSKTTEDITADIREAAARGDWAAVAVIVEQTKENAGEDMFTECSNFYVR